LGSVTQTGGTREALRLIGSALDAGITFFDTADVYGQGTSEQILGKALRRHRDRVVIATKAGYGLPSAGWLTRRVKPILRSLVKRQPGLIQSVRTVRRAQQRQDFSDAYLRRALEASLRRLGTETVDVFFLHSPPPEVLQRGEVFETVAALQQEGKIRLGGVSCRRPSDVVFCLSTSAVHVVQVEMNLLCPDAIHEVLPEASRRGVAVVARQPLASGSLLHMSGELSMATVGGGGAQTETQRAVLERTRQWAIGRNWDLRTLALQFVTATDGVTVTLIGTTNVQHLQENLKLLASPGWDRTQWQQVAEIVRATGVCATSSGGRGS